jgi:uncharacterized protein YecE (DUF72 family)
VEFRHESWFCSGIERLLADHNAALCLADRGSRWVTPCGRTADWGYIRFHEGRASPHPCYGPEALASRARTIAQLWSEEEDVYAFFNNDWRGCALRDAGRFAQIMQDAGRVVSRAPEPSAIDVG